VLQFHFQPREHHETQTDIEETFVSAFAEIKNTNGYSLFSGTATNCMEIAAVQNKLEMYRSMLDIHSATAEIRRGKTKELECGPMPNVMAALPNIHGALRSTPQS